MRPEKTFQHLIVMGVSGCGKSTLAQALAAQLGWRMLEGDAFHPPRNIAKMVAGEPLNDKDRAPWLLELNQQLQNSESQVLSCSALKASYRTILSQGLKNPPLFVHAHSGYEALLARMVQRTQASAHFMPASLLRSQFETLELPVEAGLRCVTVSVEQSTAEQVATVLEFLTPPQHR